MAEQLHLPLNVLVVSKITLPWNTEAGYGAVAADGSYQINEPLAAQLGLDAATIEDGIDKTKTRVSERAQTIHKITGENELKGRSVILVDDGLASGFTLRVAIKSARNQKAKQIIVAVPTGYSTSVIAVADQCDHLYCANVREGMRYAVAEAYESWYDVDEQEVITTLKQFQRIHQAS
jgi:predicted phosphoribosyltransferase